VDASSQYNRRSRGNGLRFRLEIGDYEHVAVVSSQRLAHRGLTDPIFLVHDLAQVPLEVGVRVRVAVGQVHFVVIVFELHFEGQRAETVG